MSLADGVGLIGAGLIVAAYLGLQLERLDARSWRYSLLNAAGAAAILASLFFEFNLGAFVIEAFWLAISLYGLARAYMRKTP